MFMNACTKIRDLEIKKCVLDDKKINKAGFCLVKTLPTHSNNNLMNLDESTINGNLVSFNSIKQEIKANLNHFIIILNLLP